ncbi:mitochondrial ribosome-associated GTPase 2 isoform X2 [Phocoena sinus]|uniref:mitochondrial ribosome-associated GTPase 2 isoform X2 n=1 Tax=Phocoena sinus TaxID=42100 RepID=UPI0013C4F5D7|nr:mitochondrial ribosome-associated GTPase 2 isoform X2 [Phocoena sinus]
MIRSRLFSARSWPVLEGVGCWTPLARVSPRPGRLLPQHASPRLLSVSCVDCTKHQEPPRKKLLSEKKLKRHFVDHRRVLVRGGRGGDGLTGKSSPCPQSCLSTRALTEEPAAGRTALGEAAPSSTSSNRAPTTCTPGQPGQERVLFLELKTVAHAGLVGFPNAGKSSLLRAISNARPTVASYPFTTLNPHVGVVHCEDHQQIAVADIPGIVRGAHQNRGLGLAFLRHIERCPFLLFVLDLSVPEPWTQLDDLKYELEQYREGLSERPHAVVANKVDLPQARAQLPQLQARLGREAIALSAATGENLEGLLLHLKELHDDHVAAELERGRQPLRW